MGRFLAGGLWLASGVAIAAATDPISFRFVRALDYSPSLSYRESHSAACTRVGLLPTVPLTPLNGAAIRNATWNADTARQAIGSLPSSSVDDTLVMGCCAASIFCRQVDGGSGAYKCGTHALGGYYYSNVGWTANDTLIPVYTCRLSTTDLTNATNVRQIADSLPFVGAARVVNDTANYYGTRVQVDGVRLGDISQLSQVYVGGAGCTSVEVCHNQCRRCTNSSTCGADKVCVRFRGDSYCLRSCDWSDALSKYTCPCGGQCYSVPLSSGLDFQLCANKGLNTINGYLVADDRFCTTGNWAPSQSTNLTDRLECTPSWSDISTNISGTNSSSSSPSSPYAPGPGPRLLHDANPAAVRDTIDKGEVLGHSPRLRREEALSRTMLRMPDKHDRRLAVSSGTLSTTASPTASALPRLGGSTYWSGHRYSSICPTAGAAGAGSAGLYHVSVVREGWSSSGLGSDVWTQAGLPVRQSSIPPPFNSLPITGSLTTLDLASSSSGASSIQWCRADSDCPWVDVCSIPRCDLSGGSATRGGCCVYAPSGRCQSADAIPANGWAPQSSAYFMLPKEISSVLPLPPPPKGDVNSAGYLRPVANMSVRDAGINPTAFSWDPASVWYANVPVNVSNSSGASLVQPFARPYVFSALTSRADDGPLDPIALPFNVSFYGQSMSQLNLGANGFLRVVSTSPCSGSFAFGSCDTVDGYSGIIAPLVTDFDPGNYYDSEIYYGAFDASALSAADCSRSAGLPAAQSACAVWLNMGLWQGNDVPAQQDPPNPSFSFLACIYADGAIRWRYGQVLGIAGYNVNSWSASDPVPRTGGPPNTTQWLAGIRSLSSTYHMTSDVDFNSLYPPAALPAAEWDDGEVDLNIPTQTLLTRDGVRQGASAALCAYAPIACPVPSCGDAGTVVAMTWSPPACGLGFEALTSQSSSTAGGAGLLPRLECLFGDIPVVADVIPSPANGANSSMSYNVQCTAPFIPGGYTGKMTVPLRLQLVLSASVAGYAPRQRQSVLVGGISPRAGNGIGSPAPYADSSTGTVAVPLEVYGVECMSGNGTCSPSAAGGRRMVAVGSLPSSGVQKVIVSKPLTFTYSHGSSSCGCSASDANAVCDKCGVCGGEGTFVDCAGVCFGRAYINDCGLCVAGTTGLLESYGKDCNGACAGPDNTCNSGGGGTGGGSADDNANHTYSLLSAIVVAALITCSIALMSVIFYVGWQTIVRGHNNDDDGGAIGLEFLTLEDMGIPPGLSASSLAAIPLVKYEAKGEALAGCPVEERDTCPICMDDFKPDDTVRVLPPCKHIYHVGCIDTWFQRSTQCPTCRADLRSPEELAAVEQARQQMQRQRAIVLGQSPPAEEAPAQVTSETGAAQPAAGAANTAGAGGRRGRAAQRSSGAVTSASEAEYGSDSATSATESGGGSRRQAGATGAGLGLMAVLPRFALGRSRRVAADGSGRPDDSDVTASATEDSGDEHSSVTSAGGAGAMPAHHRTGWRTGGPPGVSHPAPLSSSLHTARAQSATGRHPASVHDDNYDDGAEDGGPYFRSNPMVIQRLFPRGMGPAAAAAAGGHASTGASQAPHLSAVDRQAR